jgi:hypothetical protein
MSPNIIIKANGEREPFDHKKIRRSLMRSKASPEIADAIIEQIEREFEDEITTSELYQRAFEYLKQHQRGVAIRYSLRKAIMDMGPTGFPFEQFIAEIYRAKGYEVTTEFTAQGKCAEHEIDVSAWNDKELIFVEAKFHNDHGTKSDLKVALYIKSRWDDLKDIDFSGFGESKRKMDKGILITNTKFTESAVQYAKCQNMELIGWNYPEVGNLQDLIEETGLHPITCLTSISQAEEKRIMEAGIVLCKQAKDNPDILKQAGFDDEKIIRIIDEIKLIQK